MSILPPKRKQDRGYSVAGAGVGETLSPGFAGVSRLCLPFSSCFGVGEVVGLAAGAITGVVTVDGAADTADVALGEADGLIGKVLIGSSWRARDFFRPNVFGFAGGFSSPSFGETEAEIVAVAVGETADDVGLGLTDGDGVPVNLAAASAMHAQGMQNFFILVLDIYLLRLFERNSQWSPYLGDADGGGNGDSAGVNVTVSILSRRKRCTFA